jgi:hypothetical protein
MFKSILVIAAVFSLSGCDAGKPAQGNALATLPGEEPVRKWEFETLKSQVDDIRTRQTARLLVDHTTVSLNPNSTGFSLLDTPVGPIALRIDDVSAYANGSRIKLALGNTTSATLLKPSATIEWGSVNEKGEELEPAGTLTARQLTDRLEAGRWKFVTLPLANLPPAKVGYVRFRMGNIDGMELSQSADDPA